MNYSIVGIEMKTYMDEVSARYFKAVRAREKYFESGAYKEDNELQWRMNTYRYDYAVAEYKAANKSYDEFMRLMKNREEELKGH